MGNHTNIKTIVIYIPTEAHLRRILSTPALKQLFRGSLIVGDNTMNVNHYTYSQIERMQCSLYQLK